MKQYIITITVNVPYPREFTYKRTASSVGLAVKRALSALRKDLPRKRIDTYKILVADGGTIGNL